MITGAISKAAEVNVKTPSLLPAGDLIAGERTKMAAAPVCNSCREPLNREGREATQKIDCNPKKDVDRWFPDSHPEDFRRWPEEGCSPKRRREDQEQLDGNRISIEKPLSPFFLSTLLLSAS